MKIAQLRNHPFLLLVLKDGESEGYFSAEFMHKTKQQLSDMSLRIASDNLSIIYADQIKKGCEIVLGMSNLGLLDLCGNDTEKAKSIIRDQGIVYCFRAGWAKYAELKKISPTYFEDISITRYAQGISDTSDISLMHGTLVKEGQQSARLLQIYKHIGASYSANSLIIDHDEDVLTFELQKFLNTGVALLLIDSEKKVFTNTLYQQFITYLTGTEKDVLHSKLAACISRFTEQLSATTKTYLQEVNLLDFNDLTGIINQQENAAMYSQDILELPMTVSNELNNDFDGGYDFHADDEDDIAYLRPDA
ncbi:hypothetical protein [Paraglaciecola polaris]|uniref:Uncharacterized protein n=1 Tax=Paraglaciecola polaris LMG 21857 TaxID=1129793 RepID=K6ZSN3_9ALTE|nr:hypothetical protein [Paraglaciecola polaris]GAC31833.1 hypothetical protein GPLA_0917 [Paraglaciecola polaris LMG 21857]|tara:strand:+ start:1409 stop:2326 length:918 start_codon:yes stop_codon:yes gene_type:complete